MTTLALELTPATTAPATTYTSYYCEYEEWYKEDEDNKEVLRGLCDDSVSYMIGEGWRDDNLCMVENILLDAGYEYGKLNELYFINDGGYAVRGFKDLVGECYSYYGDGFHFDLDDWEVVGDDNFEALLYRIGFDRYKFDDWDLNDWKHYGESASWVQDFYHLSRGSFVMEYGSNLEDGYKNKTIDEMKSIIKQEVGEFGLASIEHWIDMALER